MSGAAKVQEPTMEEILASIRRIIADDDVGDTRPAIRAVPSPVVEPEPEPEPEMESAPEFEQEQEPELAEDAAEDIAPEPEQEPALIEAPAEIESLETEREEDVLELTRPVIVTNNAKPAEAAASSWTPEAVNAAPPAPHVDTQALPRGLDEGLIAQETRNVVENAFGSLTHTVFGQSARTLDEVVQDMLRPMLKSWLDDNLPGIVERMVRAEIERVSRGSRR